MYKAVFADRRHFCTTTGALKPHEEWDDITAAIVTSVETFDEYADGHRPRHTSCTIGRA
jgi:hypothetical protein